VIVQGVDKVHPGNKVRTVAAQLPATPASGAAAQATSGASAASGT
jgi:membrane fusion protein (multidrug efflux system)